VVPGDWHQPAHGSGGVGEGLTEEAEGGGQNAEAVRARARCEQLLVTE
jgi:hypothetical protein